MTPKKDDTKKKAKEFKAIIENDHDFYAGYKIETLEKSRQIVLHAIQP